MNTLLKTSMVAATLAMAGPAAAKPLDIQVAMKSYSGHRAYVVAYIVGPNGEYVSTVHAAGSRERYLADLSRWYRMLRRSRRGIDGTTGASVGSGSGFRTTIDIPDKMFDAGYVLRVESAVENQYYYADDAAIALNSSNNGSSVDGAGYVGSLKIGF